MTFEKSQDVNDSPQADKMNNVPSSSDEVQDQSHVNELRRGYKYNVEHSLDNLFTDINRGIRTCSSIRNFCAFLLFVSHIEPKHYAKAFKDPNCTLPCNNNNNNNITQCDPAFTRSGEIRM